MINFSKIQQTNNLNALRYLLKTFRNRNSPPTTHSNIYKANLVTTRIGRHSQSRINDTRTSLQNAPTRQTTPWCLQGHIVVDNLLGIGETVQEMRSPQSIFRILIEECVGIEHAPGLRGRVVKGTDRVTAIGDGCDTLVVLVELPTVTPHLQRAVSTEQTRIHPRVSQQIVVSLLATVTA